MGYTYLNLVFSGEDNILNQIYERKICFLFIYFINFKILKVIYENSYLR